MSKKNFILRHIQPILASRFNTSRAIYLFGPRQAGKTFLAKSSFPNLPYISLEDPDTFEYIQADPRGFFSKLPDDGAIIDEPQRFPALFSYLQGQIDNTDRKFVLTSSQNFLTMGAITQSLAGRITLLKLFPLTTNEIINAEPLDLSDFTFVNNLSLQKKFKTIDTVWSSMLKGGYPEVICTPGLEMYWYADYVKTYIERDIRRIINVQDLALFQRFMHLCSGRTGNIINKSSLANDCGISEATCTRWLNLLEQSGIIFVLKPYFNNFNKRQIKAPKIFFVDPGLCCYLMGIKTIEHLTCHPLLGAIVETYVISEIYKNFLNRGQEPEFYYWRDQHGTEIDLLVQLADGKIMPIEIKAGQTVTMNMFTALHKWCEITSVDSGLLLYGGSTLQQRNGVTVLPIGALI